MGDCPPACIGFVSGTLFSHLTLKVIIVGVQHLNLAQTPCWTGNPKLWFLQVEALLHSYNVKGDTTKYNAVTSVLDCIILQQVSNLLENPPASNKYDALKSVLVNAFSGSSERQQRKLLTEVDLQTDFHHSDRLLG